MSLEAPPPTPGVYFYADSGCGGDSSGARTGSMDDIQGLVGGDQTSPEGDHGSFEIVDSKIPGNQHSYGVILHAEIGLEKGGECKEPIVDEGCQTIGIDDHAADIFELNEDHPGSSGLGVDFYSEPNGWAGNMAGFKEVLGISIQSPSSSEDPSSMCFDYTNVKEPDAYKYLCPTTCETNKDCPGAKATCDQETGKCAQAANACNKINPNDKRKHETPGVDCSANGCSSFQDCPGSINIKGKYLVGLYSTDPDDKSKLYCQTFDGTTRKVVQDLNTEPIIGSGGKTIDKIVIIPIK